MRRRGGSDRGADGLASSHLQARLADRLNAVFPFRFMGLRSGGNLKFCSHLGSHLRRAQVGTVGGAVAALRGGDGRALRAGIGLFSGASGEVPHALTVRRFVRHFTGRKRRNLRHFRAAGVPAAGIMPAACLARAGAGCGASAAVRLGRGLNGVGTARGGSRLSSILLRFRGLRAGFVKPTRRVRCLGDPRASA